MASNFALAHNGEPIPAEYHKDFPRSDLVFPASTRNVYVPCVHHGRRCFFRSCPPPDPNI